MFLSPTRAITRYKRRWCLGLFAIAFVLTLAPAHGQSGGGVDQIGTGGRHAIQGRIYFPSGRRTDVRVKVRLENFMSGELSVMSDSNGSFSFRGLVPGSYTVKVDGGDDYEPASEPVYIDTDGSNPSRGVVLPKTSRLFTVQISLREKRSVTTKPGVLSAELASAPAPSRELYLEALKSARAGDHKKAVDQLKAALSHYPNFPLALNELGVQYLTLGQPEKALEVLANATRISPREFTPRLNYGVALMESKRLDDAVTQLREALSTNDNSWAGHMYLGITLMRMGKLDEAEQELLRTLALGGDNLALPHRYLGGIYWGRQQYKRAADELEKYLKHLPNAPDAERTKATIKELRSK